MAGSMTLGRPLELMVVGLMTLQGDSLCEVRRERTPVVIVFNGWFGVERYNSWKPKV